MALKPLKDFFGKLFRKEPAAKTYSAEQEGLVYNNNDSEMRVQISGADREILNDTQAQTVSSKSIDADANTITNIDNDEIKAAAGIDASKLADGSVSDTELQYINSVTSNVQDQIDSKASGTDLTNHIADTTTHGTTGDIVGTSDAQVLTVKTIDADSNTITNIANDEIKAAAAIDATKIADGSVTSTEFQYINSLSSNAQDQIDSKAVATDLSDHISDTTTHGTTGDIVGTSDTQTLSAKTFSDSTTFQSDVIVEGKPILDSADDATSGSDITLSLPTKGVVRLTSGTLVSIDTIAAGTNSQLLTLINDSGNSIILKNTAAKIITGTSEDISMADQASLNLIYDGTDTAWRVVGGSGGGSGSGGLTQVIDDISSETTGTFNTGTTGNPIITAKFWDDSAGEFNELSPASLTLDVSSNGSNVSYDTNGLTFDASDFVRITASYSASTSPSTEYDSGFVAVSAINDTPAAGSHRVDLPTGFADRPSGYTLMLDNGSSLFPADVASRLIFDDDGAGTQRITVDTSGLAGTDKFRLRASASTLPVTAGINGPNKNYIINGNMDFWQRGTGELIIDNSASFLADRFELYDQGDTSALGYSRSTDIPALAESGAISTYSLKIRNTTVTASLATSVESRLQYNLEGYDASELLSSENATMSFWVKSNKTGTYSINFNSAAFDRTYTTTYIINSVSTWEKKTITIPAATAYDDGTWNYTTGVGLGIRFYLAAGTDGHTATLNAWKNNNGRVSSSQANFHDTTDNEIYFSQLKFEKGSEATTFGRCGSSIADELEKCQRYYGKSYNTETIPGTNTGFSGSGVYQIRKAGVEIQRQTIGFDTKMRTSPTITNYRPDVADTQGSWTNLSGGASAITATGISAGERGFTVQFTPTGSETLVAGHWTADAEL